MKKKYINYGRGVGQFREEHGRATTYLTFLLCAIVLSALLYAAYGTGDSPLYHVNLDMVFVFEKEEDVTICHLYDDRGFQIFLRELKQLSQS